MTDLGRTLEFWNLYNRKFVIIVYDYGLLVFRDELLVGGGSNIVVGTISNGRAGLGDSSIESESLDVLGGRIRMDGGRRCPGDRLA